MIASKSYTNLLENCTMDKRLGELRVYNSTLDAGCILWETFGNTSMTDSLTSSSPSARFFSTSFLPSLQWWWWNDTEFHVNQTESENVFDYSFRWSVIGLFILILFTESQITSAKIFNRLDTALKNTAIMLFNVFFFLLTAPFIFSLLLCFFIYRRAVDVLLKVTMGDIYRGLLEGTDSIWAIENPSGLSVINALGVLEVDKSQTNILDDLRYLIKDRLMSPRFEKLWSTRSKKCGYYYWKKASEVDLKERVRWLNSDKSKECTGNCNNIHGGLLKQLITKVCNQPLPQQHSVGWEILVGDSCEKCQVRDVENHQVHQLKQSVPVLFRIHHSLGDGVALLRLLLEVIADQDHFDCTFPLNPEGIINPHGGNDAVDGEQRPIPLLRQRSSFCDKFVDSHKIIYYSADLLSASMPFVRNKLTLKTFTWRKIKTRMIGCYQQVVMLAPTISNKVISVVHEFFKCITALMLLPSFLFRQSLRCMDDSAIHGPLLSGNKIISCWLELEDLQRVGDASLLDKIRDIKNKTRVRFGDVILTALSASIHQYFHQTGKAAPKQITVVVPMRMSQSSPKLVLENGFSVALLPLCVSNINGKVFDCSSTTDRSDPWQSFDRLYDISQASAKLRNDLDYLMNYWVMAWLSAALPEFFLRPLLCSRSTMVFSNLPGPHAVQILGNTLKRIVFWIPNRGTTGIGCAFLSYNGSVSLSMLADGSVIGDERCLDEIVRGTVGEIKRMHENIQRAHLLANFKSNSKVYT